MGADVWNLWKQCRCIALQKCSLSFGESVRCRSGMVETWAVCPITCPCLRGRVPRRRTSSLRHRQQPQQRRSTIGGTRLPSQSFATTGSTKSSHHGQRGHSVLFGSLCETGRHDVGVEVCHVDQTTHAHCIEAPLGTLNWSLLMTFSS